MRAEPSDPLVGAEQARLVELSLLATEQASRSPECMPRVEAQADQPATMNTKAE